MEPDTYISIIFAILIAALLGNFINILSQQSSQDKKKYTKILVLLTASLIIAATIFYKYNLFISCVSEIFSYIIECIPFFYNSLTQHDSTDSRLYMIAALFGVFSSIIIFFHSNYSELIDEKSSKIYFIIVEMIYIIINAFLLILSYYIFYNVSFYISFIIFILMCIFAIKKSTVYRLIDLAQYLEDIF